MDVRRFAAFLLGAWLLGSCAMFFVATRNFQGVTRLLETPSAGASSRIEQLGPADARLLLRYQVSELNRLYFATWERMQIALGVILLAVLARNFRRKRHLVTALILLVIVTGAHLLLTPEITRLGRLLDFVPDARQTADGQTFWRLHQTYSTLEVFKFLLGAYLAFEMLRPASGGRAVSGGAGREMNFVDNREHGRVDG